MSTCVYPVCYYFIMVKQVILWHGFVHSSSTQQLQLVSMYKPCVKIIFGKSASVCVCFKGQSCSFVQRPGWPQVLPSVMGVHHTHPWGQNYFSLCSFRVKIWQMIWNWDLAQCTCLKVLSMKKFHCLWVACFPNMGTTKFHASVMHISYDQFHWWYQCYALWR